MLWARSAVRSVLTGALRNPVILSAIASSAGIAVSLTLGMPIVMLWAPVIATLGFVRFYSTCLSLFASKLLLLKCAAILLR